MTALPIMALGMIIMPKSATDWVRLRTAPAFSPLQNIAENLTLDLAGDNLRRTAEAPSSENVDLREQLSSRDGALAEAAATLAWYDRQLRNVSRIRDGLDNLPCRLVPARLQAPEIAGARAGGRLTEGAAAGVRKRGAVITSRIDRGLREAIERGEPVLSTAGLVGFVDEVGPNSSTVRLVTDPRSTVMVQVITRRDGQWRAGPEGIARGTADGVAVTVLNIPRSADVAAGDFVVTSPSPEAALPPYLIVGKVVSAELKPAELYWNLVVDSRFEPGESAEVYVVSPEPKGSK